MMRIRVLFFAAYRELVGQGFHEVTLSPGSTVGELLQELWALGDPFQHLPAAPVVAVNRAFASTDTRLSDGDEVAFIPPVAGG